MNSHDACSDSPLLLRIKAGRDLWDFLTLGEIAEFYAPGDLNLQEEYELRLWQSVFDGMLRFGEPALYDRRSGLLAAQGMIHCQEFRRFIHVEAKSEELHRVTDGYLSTWIHPSRPPAETPAARLPQNNELSEQEAVDLFGCERVDNLLGRSGSDTAQLTFPCSPRHLAQVAYELGVHLPPEFIRQLAWTLASSDAISPLPGPHSRQKATGDTAPQNPVAQSKSTKPFGVEYPLYIREVIKAIHLNPRQTGIPLTTYLHIIWLAADDAFSRLVLHTEGLRKKKPNERIAKDFITAIAEELTEGCPEDSPRNSQIPYE